MRIENRSHVIEKNKKVLNPPVSEMPGIRDKNIRMRAVFQNRPDFFGQRVFGLKDNHARQEKPRDKSGEDHRKKLGGFFQIPRARGSNEKAGPDQKRLNTS